MTITGSGATRGSGDGLHNEDAFVVNEGVGLYLVCDGESTRPAGEVAARLAAESATRVIEEASRSRGAASDSLGEHVVEDALRAALSAVANAGDDSPELAGLSTSITVLLVHGPFGVVGHCGDSRLYVIRNGRLSQLTVDHALTSERSPEPTGDAALPDFEVFTTEIEPGDTLVLCSDGASAVINDPAFLRSARDLSPRMLASRIVSAASQRGPDQDATAVIVHSLRSRRGRGLALSSRPRMTAFGHVLDAWSAADADDEDRRATRTEGSGEESS